MNHAHDPETCSCLACNLIKKGVATPTGNILPDGRTEYQLETTAAADAIDITLGIIGITLQDLEEGIWQAGATIQMQHMFPQGQDPEELMMQRVPVRELMGVTSSLWEAFKILANIANAFRSATAGNKEEGGDEPLTDTDGLSAIDEVERMLRQFRENTHE